MGDAQRDIAGRNNGPRQRAASSEQHGRAGAWALQRDSRRNTKRQWDRDRGHVHTTRRRIPRRDLLLTTIRPIVPHFHPQGLLRSLPLRYTLAHIHKVLPLYAVARVYAPLMSHRLSAQAPPAQSASPPHHANDARDKPTNDVRHYLPRYPNSPGASLGAGCPVFLSTGINSLAKFKPMKRTRKRAVPAILSIRMYTDDVLDSGIVVIVVCGLVSLVSCLTLFYALFLFFRFRTAKRSDASHPLHTCHAPRTDARALAFFSVWIFATLVFLPDFAADHFSQATTTSAALRSRARTSRRARTRSGSRPCTTSLDTVRTRLCV